MDIMHIALALGSSVTAGINLYLTILSLGAMHRLEWLTLPESMEVVANPWVMITAGVLFLVEFFADKIPYVDNVWDTVHTFIRVPAGAYLAASSFTDMPQEYLIVAALLGGAVSFTTHGAKASTRAAVNASPEPVSNWVLSFGEDALSLGLLYLVSSYPYVALVVGLIIVLAAAAVIYLLFRFFKRIFSGSNRPAPAQQPPA
ncbi:MAG TPA: DUF4126 domain-containing protein [Acidobacteriota bacterium]|nr:DUF4126 domain-containing protein [Acidobacteriota bacterium]